MMRALLLALAVAGPIHADPIIVGDGVESRGQVNLSRFNGDAQAFWAYVFSECLEVHVLAGEYLAEAGDEIPVPSGARVRGSWNAALGGRWVLNSDVVVDGVRFLEPVKATQGSHHVTLKGCLFENVQVIGENLISMPEVYYLRVTECHFEAIVCDDVIWFSGGVTPATEGGHSSITDNSFEVTGLSGSVIEGDKAKFTTITDNRIGRSLAMEEPVFKLVGGMGNTVNNNNIHNVQVMGNPVVFMDSIESTFVGNCYTLQHDTGHPWLSVAGAGSVAIGNAGFSN